MVEKSKKLFFYIDLEYKAENCSQKLQKVKITQKSFLCLVLNLSSLDSMKKIGLKLCFFIEFSLFCIIFCRLFN